MFDLFKQSKKISFHSPYSKKEIFDILEKNIDTSHIRLFIGGGSSSKDILGIIEKDHFKIQKKRKCAQPDIPYLYGTLYKADKGTLLVCYFDSSRNGTILFFIGLILLLIIEVISKVFN